MLRRVIYRWPNALSPRREGSIDSDNAVDLRRLFAIHEGNNADDAEDYDPSFPEPISVVRSRMFRYQRALGEYCERRCDEDEIYERVDLFTLDAFDLQSPEQRKVADMLKCSKCTKRLCAYRPMQCKCGKTLICYSCYTKIHENAGSTDPEQVAVRPCLCVACNAYFMSDFEEAYHIPSVVASFKCKCPVFSDTFYWRPITYDDDGGELGIHRCLGCDDPKGHGSVRSKDGQATACGKVVDVGSMLRHLKEHQEQQRKMFAEVLKGRQDIEELNLGDVRLTWLSDTEPDEAEVVDAGAVDSEVVNSESVDSSSAPTPVDSLAMTEEESKTTPDVTELPEEDPQPLASLITRRRRRRTRRASSSTRTPRRVSRRTASQNHPPRSPSY